MIQKSHLHHYTLEEILQLAGSTGYQIKDFYYTTKEEHYSDLCKQQYEGLKGLLGRNQDLLKAYQFYFSLERKSDLNGVKDPDRLDETSYYSIERNEIISLITHNKEEEITVLEVGCGSGATLNKIKELYPKAKVYGIELEQEVVQKNPYQLNLIYGNIERMVLPYEKGMFDYIIFADVLEHLYDPNKVLMKIKPYLKSCGFVISSIPNILHASVIVPLMRGRFTYRNSGILDRTHIRFFTIAEIKRLFENSGYTMDQLFYSEGKEEDSQEAKRLLEMISELPEVVGKEQFHAFQYLVKYHLSDRVAREIKDLQEHMDEQFGMQMLKSINVVLKNLALHVMEQSEQEKQQSISQLLQLAKRYHGIDSYQAFILLSFLLMEFMEEQSIPLIVDLTMQEEFKLRVEEKFYILRQLQTKIFRTPSLDTKVTKQKVESLYQHLFDTLCEEYQDRLVAIPREKRDSKKVFVMTDQFLKKRHAPTHSALERSYYLSALGGKRVKIVNTLGGSSTKGQIIWWKYYISSELGEYKDWTEYNYKDQVFEFWQSKLDLFDTDSISSILDLVIEEKPEYILNIGGQSIVADLCSMIVPTIALATVFSKLPVTLGTFSVIGRKLAEEEWKEIIQKGIPREAIREVPFTFELQEQTNHFKREDYQIPASAFALAVVGTRLSQDVSDEFIQVIEKTYAYGTHLVFVGFFETYHEMCKRHPGLREHSSYTGYCDDVLALMELCDLYVNPKRTGGGFSVIEAFRKKVPCVSLAFGDVATAAGEEFCVASYEDMVQEILHYQTDASYYELKAELASKRADFMTDGSKVFLQCMESIEQSPLFF
jgi:SAM-dependent methyltransferase/glycosyltransferase involved in cell wall biosynthesis